MTLLRTRGFAGLDSPSVSPAVPAPLSQPPPRSDPAPTGHWPPVGNASPFKAFVQYPLHPRSHPSVTPQALCHPLSFDLHLNVTSTQKSSLNLQLKLEAPAPVSPFHSLHLLPSQHLLVVNSLLLTRTLVPRGQETNLSCPRSSPQPLSKSVISCRS